MITKQDLNSMTKRELEMVRYHIEQSDRRAVRKILKDRPFWIERAFEAQNIELQGREAILREIRDFTHGLVGYELPDYIFRQELGRAFGKFNKKKRQT